MMAFHKSNLGAFGESLPSDMDGYMPEENDDVWQFAVDHGGHRTHDDAGDLTEYGQWWEEEGFDEWLAEAVQATTQAVEALENWQQ
jgi:hypothetical protein